MGGQSESKAEDDIVLPQAGSATSQNFAFIANRFPKFLNLFFWIFLLPVVGQASGTPASPSQNT
jgi:hypothetical protein